MSLTRSGQAETKSNYKEKPREGTCERFISTAAYILQRAYQESPINFSFISGFRYAHIRRIKGDSLRGQWALATQKDGLGWGKLVEYTAEQVKNDPRGMGYFWLDTQFCLVLTRPEEVQQALLQNGSFLDNDTDIFQRALRDANPFGLSMWDPTADVPTLNPAWNKMHEDVLDKENLDYIENNKDCWLQTIALQEKEVIAAQLKEQKEDNKYLSKRMLEEMAMFITAGHETTAVFKQCFLMLLAEHPEIQEELRKNLIQSNENGIESKYLGWVVKEVLRLYPPVPILKANISGPLIFADVKEVNSRAAYENAKQQRDASKDVKVVAGDMVFMSLYDIHRNKDVYGPDADAFKPSRWENLVVPPGSYLPFGPDGKRQCPDQHLVRKEAKIISEMVLNFEIQPVKKYLNLPGDRLPIQKLFTSRLSEDVKLKFVPHPELKQKLQVEPSQKPKEESKPELQEVLQEELKHTFKENRVLAAKEDEKNAWELLSPRF